MTRPAYRRWLGGSFTGVTLAWLLLLLLAPSASFHEAGGRAAAVAAAGTYLIGGVVCHQRPDRSFHPGGAQMPVCARCAGLYLGAGVGVLAAGARRRRGADAQPAGTGRAPTWPRWVLAAAAAPTALAFAAEAAGWMPSVGELRAAAAVPLGVAVTWVASLVIRGDLA